MNRIQTVRSTSPTPIPAQAPSVREPRTPSVSVAQVLASIDDVVEGALSTDSQEFVTRNRQRGGE